MALNATVFKTAFQVTDMDRHYYQAHTLTIARHPSETDERMMVRLLAFALHADEELAFTRGLSTDDEPDLWQKNLSDEIEIWIDLGQIDEKRIRKACARASQVYIYTYRGRSARVWWEKICDKLERFSNLNVIHLPDDVSQSMAKMVRRTMQLQCTIQDGEAWLTDGSEIVRVAPQRWKQSRTNMPDFEG